MKNPSKKRLAKRQKKDAEHRQRDRERSRRAQLLSVLPAFRYEHNGAPEDLINAVKKAIATAVCEQSKVFDEEQRLFLKDARMYGFKQILSIIKKTPMSIEDLARLSPERLAGTVFALLPAEIQNGHFPVNSFRMVYGNPRPNEILVKFDSLEQIKAPGGTCYRSRTPPLIIDGVPHALAFSNHAVERIAQRIVALPDPYAGSLFTFLALSGSGFTVDQCSLPAGERAIRLWVKVFVDDSPMGKIPEAVLGYKPSAGMKFCYLAGYGPLVFHRDIAVAKTLLSPAMKNTPEASLINLRKLDLRTFQRMKGKIDDQSLKRIFNDGDFEVMRLLHDEGFEQVRPDV